MGTAAEKTGLVEREDEMSDTPRTNNAAGDGTTVPADFAADLERELEIAKAFHDVAVTERNFERVVSSRLQRELATTKAEVEKAEVVVENSYIEIKRMRKENLKLEDEIEKLRAALDATRDYLYDRSSLSSFDLDEMYVAAVGAKETK
jgi:uncharacterized protein YdcH (DUF465 family)